MYGEPENRVTIPRFSWQDKCRFGAHGIHQRKQFVINRWVKVTSSVVSVSNKNARAEFAGRKTWGARHTCPRERGYVWLQHRQGRQGTQKSDLGEVQSSIRRSSKPPAERRRRPRCATCALAPGARAHPGPFSARSECTGAPTVPRRNAHVRPSTSRLFRGRPASSQAAAQIRIGESGAERALNG